MSSCTIESECDDGYITPLQQIIRRANKNHTCGECRRVINKGEKYEIFKGVYYGEMFSAKTCLDCLSLRDSFFKGGFNFGTIKDEIAESINDSFGEVDSSCIVDLTPAAKEFVFERIEWAWEE